MLNVVVEVLEGRISCLSFKEDSFFFINKNLEVLLFFRLFFKYLLRYIFFFVKLIIIII